MDKLTDKRLLTVTATASADGSPSHVYQLTFKCDGQPREFGLSTWTKGATGSLTPRPMAWESRTVQTGGEVTTRDATTNAPRAYAPVVQSDVVAPKSYRYRVDSATAAASMLTRVTDNVAHVLPTDVFVPPPPPIDSGGALSPEQEHALARLAAANSTNPPTPALPTSRLIVAEVFPGEVVEFSFAALSADAEASLRMSCGFADPAAVAEAQKQAQEAQQKAQDDAQQAAADDAKVKAILAAHPDLRGVNVVEPKVVKGAPAVYPELAKAARVQGAVVLQVTIGRDGKVKNIAIERHAPMPALDSAAVAAVSHWEYSPRLIEGIPTEAVIQQTINFTLK